VGGRRRAAEGAGDEGVERVTLDAAALDAAAVPGRILIAPWGEVQSSTGTFVVDDEAAQATIASFRAHGTDVPVDYEHQTLGGGYSSPTGLAPAAGWIKALSAVSPVAAQNEAAAEPGLWADVQWTEEALERLRRREYRYLSPVALVRRSDHRLIGIHSVALTNKPAIVGMKPVVNRDPVPPPAPGEAMPDEQAPSEETVVAVKVVGEGGDFGVMAAARGLRIALALGENAGVETILLAATERIRTLEMEGRLRAASDRVSRAMTSGKLTPAQRDWAMALARRDLAAFEEWEAAAPVIVSLGRLSAPADATGSGLTARRAAEVAARSEWRTHREFLEQICSEEAYVAQALRESVAGEG
jgi:phage I-like protein